MQVTLNVPDNKMDFFLELVKNLGFVKVDSSSNSTLTPQQKELVDIEVEKSKNDPNYMMDLEDAWKTLKIEG